MGIDDVCDDFKTVNDQNNHNNSIIQIHTIEVIKIMVSHTIKAKNKSKKLREIIDSIDPNLNIVTEGNRGDAMRHTRQYIKNIPKPIHCEWSGCGKKHEKLRVCSGCRMSYYCSKSCQKKSWKIQHGNVCHKLSQYYA